MNELQESLLVKGLNMIMVSKEYSEIKSNILQNYAEILESRLDKVFTSIQMNILEGILVSKPSLLKEDFWKNYVEQALLQFKDASLEFFHENGAWYVLLNRAKDIYEDVDWFDVLVKLSESTAKHSIGTPGFKTVLKWLVDSNKNYLKKLLYRTETKKYPRNLKVSLYKQLIEFGMLDNKIARRIRSDSSGQLSVDVLAYLFASRTKYSDEDFKNLIMQFCDTKHKWVARFIALNMPIDLVPFLMGLDDGGAIKILEKRLYN